MATLVVLHALTARGACVCLKPFESWVLAVTAYPLALCSVTTSHEEGSFTCIPYANDVSMQCINETAYTQLSVAPHEIALRTRRLLEKRIAINGSNSFRLV
jgi:hypothetical protein